MAPTTTRSFIHEGRRLVFDEFGEGPRPIVLLHGLLLSRRMHAPLAEELAERGNRVICLDLLGHGDADRPQDMACYSMPRFAEEVVALLDFLELDEAVVGGTSLGANVSLEAGVLAPRRLRGLVVEMPVLDNALLACALAFTPLLVGLTFGAPVARALGRAAELVPRGISHLGDTVLDTVRQDPGPSAAVIQGLFFDRTAPPRAARRAIRTRTLVIGHPRDPIHPFSDAGALVDELPAGRLLEAESLLELRLRPERLTGEIARFLDGCWTGRPAARPSAKRRQGRRAAAASEDGTAAGGRSGASRRRRRTSA